MPPNGPQVRGLNLRIDMTKVDEALAAQPRITVTSGAEGQPGVTLLEISRTAARVAGELDDNQVNVLC